MPDVVIVGAGPAGSTLAYRLARDGVDVALVEKATMPRVKPCGGGLDGIFFDNLPQGMDVEAVAEGTVSTALVRYQGHNQSEYPLPRPVVMTQRAQLDHHLAMQAQEKGAKLYQGHAVTGIQRSADGVYTVQAGDSLFRAPIVVGADGAYSTVARLARIPTRRQVFVAAEWDLRAPPEVVAQWHGKLLIDSSITPVGYAWVFPKQQFLNIGFGLPRRLAKSVHRITERFARRSGLRTEWGYRRWAHLVPLALPGSRAVQDGVLLVGDAAGMIDPCSGAGIGWAVRSSAAASPWVKQALADGHPDLLDGYQRAYDAMLAELQAAMALRNILVLSFALRHRESRQAMACLIEAISGHSTYLEWARAHPWQSRLGNLLDTTLLKLLV